MSSPPHPKESTGTVQQTDLTDIEPGTAGPADRETSPPAVPDGSERAGPPAGRRLGVARYDLAALTGVMAVVAFLWGRARHVWYWIDEGIAIGIASQPLTSIPGLLRQDGAPPLYYLTLHGWISLFGTSEPATHLLSLLFALLTLPAALWAGWSLFGRRTGWMFVVLAALNPFVAYYANETRMYSLVVLLGIFTVATFAHAYAFGRRRYLPAFVASFVLLLYTHNWALFLGVGLASALALLFLVHKGDRRRLVVDGLLGFGAVGLLYAPWVPTLLYQVTHSGAPWLLRPTLLQVRSDLIDLVGTEAAVVALGLAAVLPLMGFLRWPWSRSATTTVALLAVFVVTMAAAWLVSRQNAVWTVRYLAVLVPPLLLALAVGVARGGQVALAGLVVYAMLVAPIGVKGQPFEKSNAREIVEQVEGVLQPGDLVITSFGRVPLLSLYLPPGLRYAETTGQVADEQLSDQRDAVDRLRELPPATVLPPLLEAVPPGGHVLVVCPPPSVLPPDATEFLVLVSSQCQEALRVVSGNSDFRLDLSLPANPQELGVSPEDGYLFTKLPSS